MSRLIRILKPVRIIVAGGRDFCTDDDGVTYPMDHPEIVVAHSRITQVVTRFNPEDIEVVCGLAPGGDTVGEMWAHKWRIPVKYFPAEWRYRGVYNPAAGLQRNHRMGGYGTHCISFWDGASTGTGHMIELCPKYDIELRVLRYG